MKCCISIIFFLLLFHAEGKLKIVTLHPLIGDLARNVGGDLVYVIDLQPPGTNPHTFEPAPGDMREFANAEIILASGKHLETYLENLRDLLNPDQTMIEVGRTIPSLRINVKDDVFICCPAHSYGSLDPHWWHSIKNMQRATRIIAKILGKKDPAHESSYTENAAQYREHLEKLRKWAKLELSTIPRKRRKLVTSHAAFGYFCKEFGFKAIPIQGLNKERNPTPTYLNATMKTIRKEKIFAVFPEENANPKILERITKQTGAVLGGTLLPGGPNPEKPTYEDMMRHNISTIVKALGERKS